jgi:hypothetical protein
VKATLVEAHERAQQADGEHHLEAAETHLQGSALAAYASSLQSKLEASNTGTPERAAPALLRESRELIAQSEPCCKRPPTLFGHSDSRSGS